jgi:hypothetical protein
MRLLLPGRWERDKIKEGLNSIDPGSFDGALYQIQEIKHSGVPSIFARPFAFTKALESSFPEAVGDFDRLVQGIFLGIIEIAEYKLNKLISLTNTINKFEPYVDTKELDSFYVLKWQGRSIGSMFHDCLVFPGAKFIAASVWRNNPIGSTPEPQYIERDDNGFTLDITRQALDVKIERQMNLFGRDLVKSLFRHWNNKVKETLNIPAGQLLPTWLDRLLDITVDENKWKTTLKPVGSDEDINAQFVHFTNQALDISLKLESDTLTIPMISFNQGNNIFTDSIVKFAGDKYPDLPVTSESMALLDFDNGGCTMSRKPGTSPTYEVRLKGWNEFFSWSPIEENIIDGGMASVQLWPDFKADGWNVNYVYLAVNGDLKKAYCPSIQLLKDNQGTVIKTVGIDDGPSSGCLTNFPIEYVEVLLDVRGGVTPSGIFMDDRPMVNQSSAESTISIDFGTTNTSVGSTDEKTGIADCMAFRHMTRDLFATGYWWHKDNKSLREESRFLPTAFSEDTLTSLPSELLFSSSNEKLQGHDSLKNPILHYTIPHPFFIRKSKEVSAYKMLVDDFKWKSPDVFEGDSLTKAYLKLVLHMALAQLRKDEQCVKVNIIPTYPLAFGESKYKNFKDLLENIFDEINEDTGIALCIAIVNTTRTCQELVSETKAVKAFSARMPEEGRAELVVDIGGGTTDLAMWVKIGSDVYELVESIRYGGNQYLKFLAERFKDQPRDAEGGPIENVEDRVIALQKLIREHKSGINGVFGCYRERERTAARSRINRFFTGIFFYTYRLLEKFNLKKVNFYPVGNGWRLVEGLKNPSYTIDKYVKALFDHKGIDAEVILPIDIVDLKGAVCKGSKIIEKNSDYVHPANIEVKTIAGGTVEVGGELLRWDEMVPTRALSSAPPPEINTTKFIDEFLDATGISDPGVTRSQINAELKKKFGDAYSELPAEQVGLKKSVLSVFLEHIYPRMFLY